MDFLMKKWLHGLWEGRWILVGEKAPRSFNKIRSHIWVTSLNSDKQLMAKVENPLGRCRGKGVCSLSPVPRHGYKCHSQAPSSLSRQKGQ